MAAANAAAKGQRAATPRRDQTEGESRRSAAEQLGSADQSNTLRRSQPSCSSAMQTNDWPWTPAPQMTGRGGLARSATGSEAAGAAAAGGLIEQVSATWSAEAIFGGHHATCSCCVDDDHRQKAEHLPRCRRGCMSRRWSLRLINRLNQNNDDGAS